MSGSQVRQNFPLECEIAINDQINRELYASYVYLSMSYYFNRDDVALPRHALFFKEQSTEENEHAEKLLKFQNMRGGRVIYKDIDKPPVDDWKDIELVLKTALALEKEVNSHLLYIRRTAKKKGDYQTCDFMDNQMLRHQLEEIKTFADLTTKHHRVESGLGEYLLEQHDMGKK